MGPAFVIVIWGVLAAVFGIVWLALAGVFFFALKRKKVWLRWLAGVPLALLSLLGLLLVASVTIGIIRSKNPSVVYHQAFGALPPANVTNLRSSYWFFGDSGTIYLRFECSPEVFQSLVDSGFQTTDRWRLGAMIDSMNLPGWWNLPAAEEITQIYLREDAKNHFSSESEILVYHPPSKTAFYLYSGID